MASVQSTGPGPVQFLGGGVSMPANLTQQQVKDAYQVCLSMLFPIW